MFVRNLLKRKKSGGLKLRSMDHAAGDYCRYGCSSEGTRVERGVARFAGGVAYVVGPFVGEREEREVCGLPGGEFAFDAEDASRAGGKEFDHAHEGEAAGVDELFEREG